MNYTINWKQSYPEWEQMVDTYMDMMLEASEYEEANQVIDYIKKLK
jgi:protein-arginine kinase activator protein McsA